MIAEPSKISVQRCLKSSMIDQVTCCSREWTTIDSLYDSKRSGSWSISFFVMVVKRLILMNFDCPSWLGLERPPVMKTKDAVPLWYRVGDLWNQVWNNSNELDFAPLIQRPSSIQTYRVMPIATMDYQGFFKSMKLKGSFDVWEMWCEKQALDLKTSPPHFSRSALQLMDIKWKSLHHRGWKLEAVSVWFHRGKFQFYLQF